MFQSFNINVASYLLPNFLEFNEEEFDCFIWNFLLNKNPHGNVSQPNNNWEVTASYNRGHDDTISYWADILCNQALRPL